MAYQIKQSDLEMFRFPDIKYTVKFEVYKGNEKLAELEGVTPDGQFTIDANSDVRRTCSMTLIPNPCRPNEHLELDEEGLIWLDNTVKVSIGMRGAKDEQYTYYPMGTYVFTDTSCSYDVSSHSISVNCGDHMTQLDGSKNGQVGALTTVIPAYDEDPETGEPLKYNVIREAMVQVLTQMCHITNYFVDDIGEYKGMKQYNPNWEEYRKEYDLWNTVPYDLEFSCGCTLLSILQAMRDLYPNYEMFFDENDMFVCQMIPSCEEDDVTVDDSFLQRILISEDSSFDLSTVRNICEVWGQTIDTDYFSEDCKQTNGVYVCNIEGIEEKYYNGDCFAVRVDASNVAGQKINVNSLGDLIIYDEYTENPILAGELEAGVVYVFKVKNLRIDGGNQMRAYLLGHWQAHGMSVLTDGTEGPGEYTSVDGVKMPMYSQKYFQTAYNVETVEMNVIPDSPFTVQRLGEILDVKTGGEYENITSNALAVNRAHYENWKNCRLTDSITITTLLCPFLDVNTKVSYKPHNSVNVNQYIIKSISHDFGSGTSSISMYRFYPLYENS